MIKEYYLNLKFKIFPKLAVARTAALVSNIYVSMYLSASQHKIYSCTTPLLRHYYNKYFSYFFIENLLILEEQCRILTFLLIMQVFFCFSHVCFDGNTFHNLCWSKYQYRGIFELESYFYASRSSKSWSGSCSDHISCVFDCRGD